MAAWAGANSSPTELSIAEEVAEGLKVYFDNCLGTILLYRFERLQVRPASRGWGRAPSCARCC